MQWTFWGLEAMRDWMEQAPIEAQIDGPTVSAVCSRQFRFQLEVRWHFPEGASMQSGYPGLAIFYQQVKALASVVWSANYDLSWTLTVVLFILPCLPGLTGVAEWPLHCRRLHWLPLCFLAKFKVLIITYKVLYGSGPCYLQSHKFQVASTCLIHASPDKSWSPRRKGEG